MPGRRHRCGRERLRGDAGDRRRVEPPRARARRVRRGCPRVPAGTGRRHEVAQPRPGCDAEAHCRRGSRRVLPRPGGGGHRRGHVAGGVRPGGDAGRLGRAAAARLRRRHRVRAAAQRPGGRGAAGDGPRAGVRPRLAGRRRSRARAGRGDEARVRRRLPLHRRRAAAGGLPGRVLPCVAPSADRSRASRRSGARRPAARRHRLPDGGRPRPHGMLVHPEHLHRLRLAGRRSRHGRAAAEPRRLLHSRGRPPQQAGALEAPVPHHHPGHAARRRGRGADRAVRPDGRPRAAAGAPPAAHEPALPRSRPAGRARRAPLAARPGRGRLAAVPRARASGTSPTTSSAAAIASGATPSRPPTVAARRSCCAATSWSAVPSRARTVSQPATDA